MSDEAYATNLLRGVVAQLYLQNALTISQQMFGKSLVSLSPAERTAVERTAYDLLGYFYSLLTPEFFVGPQKDNPVGFVHPAQQQNPPSAPAKP